MSTRNFLKFIITFCFLTALLYHLGQFDTGLKEVEETEYSEVFKEANLPETFNPTVFNAGFTQNKGQLKDQYGNPNNKVKYISEQAGFNVQLRESGFSYDVVREEGPENEKQWVFHRIDIDFVDAGQATIIEEEATGAIKNFQKSLMGAAGDITGVQTFRKIIYQDLYPKIDLSFEIDSSGQMEYNFIVHEGGDPAAIQLAYKGADELELVDGKLRLGTQFGAMEEVIPKSWYENEGQMEEVEVEYLALEENVISFAAPAGEGDLVIDPVPVVEFKISHKMDRVYDIALDNGYFILTGVTYQNGFASTGAHKTYYGDGLPNSIFPCSADGGDAYLIVLDKTGEKYWATYYGDGGNICLSPRNDGKVFKDLGLAVATDGNGYIYFGGETGSENGIATDNGYDDTWNGGYDGFLAKFDLVTGQRLWGTYLGGGSRVVDIVVNGSEVYASAVTSTRTQLYKFNADGSLIWEKNIAARINSIDYHAGNLYVAGTTYEPSGMAMGGGNIYQANYGGDGDGYVARYNPDNGEPVWASYYGGSGLDGFTTLQVNGPSNNTILYLGGFTESSTGIATSGVHQDNLWGERDAMLVAMNGLGSRVWGTYFGGEDAERIDAMTRQSDGSLVIGGSTNSLEGINSSPCNPRTAVPKFNEYYPHFKHPFLASFTFNGALEYGTYLPGAISPAEGVGVNEIVMYEDTMYLAFNEWKRYTGEWIGSFMKVSEEELAPVFTVNVNNGYTIQENGKSILAYNFGNNTQCSATDTFRIQNAGIGCLALTGDPDLVQLSDEVNFRIINQNMPDNNLLYDGEEATFEIVFEPSGPGDYEADVVIPNTDPDQGDYYLKIYGSSGFWNLEVSGNGNLIANNDNTPDAADFTYLGMSTCEETPARDFILKNTGTACLDIQHISVSNPAFSLSASSQYIGPGESFTLTVTAEPNFGYKTGTISILSNDLDEPIFKFDVAVDHEVGIQVQHDGVPIANGDNSPSLDDGTNFGFFEFGEEIIQTFTIKNIGPCTIQLNPNGSSSPNLTFYPDWGAYAWDFVNIPAVSELAPGDSIDFSVELSPFQPITSSITINIYNGPAQDPFYSFLVTAIVGTDFPSPVLENCPEEIEVTSSTPAPANWTPPVAFEGEVEGDPLQTGDIAFTNVSINPDGTGAFSFVTLNDIPNGTELGFSNLNWDKSKGNSVNANSRKVYVVANKDIPMGTVVNMVDSIVYIFGNPGPTRVFFDPLWFDVGEDASDLELQPKDNLFAYYYDYNFSWSEYSTRWLAAVEWAGGWDDNATWYTEKTALPEILEQSGAAISIDTMMMRYDCSLTDGSGIDIADAVNDPANWVQNATVIEDYDCSFNLTSEYRIPIELTSNYEPGDIFPLGITSVIYTGQNVIGLPVECSFDVKLGECFIAADTISGKIKWTGAIDTTWTNPCNWDRTRTPQDDELVVIPVVSSNNYPVITGEVTIQAMEVDAGAEVQVAEMGVLRIQGSENNGLFVRGKFENRGDLYVDDIVGVAIVVSNANAIMLSEYASLALIGNTYIGSQVEVGTGIFAADNSIFVVGDGVNAKPSDNTLLSIDNVLGDAMLLSGNFQFVNESNGSTTRIEIGMNSVASIGRSAIKLTNGISGALNVFSGTLLINGTGIGYPAIDIHASNTLGLHNGAVLGISEAHRGIVNEGTFDNAGSVSVTNSTIEAIANTGSFTNDGYLNVEDEVSGVDGLAGTLDVNTWIGQVHFDQNLDLSQNTLEVDVESDFVEQYDLLSTSGSLTLGGNLNVNTPFAPVQDTRIVFAQASSVVGTFNNPVLPDIWTLDYSVPGEVALVYLIEPVAVCQNITVDADATCTAIVTATQINAGSTDPNDAELSFSLDQAGPFNLGSTDVEFSVTNGVATSICNATITVVDNQDPTVNTQDLTVYLNASGQASITAEQADNGSSDNCAIDTRTLDISSFSCGDLGTNTVQLTVTDGSGNSATSSFDVTVNDTLNPTITCINDISVNATSANGAVVDYTAPEGTDNCSFLTTQTEGLASGAAFPIGTTINTFTTTDPAGNSVSCSFNVTVIGVVPDIDCPEDIILNNDIGLCSTTANFTASETVGVPASTITYSIDPGSNFPVGTTTVTATATNAVGSSSCTFDVIVIDTEAPSLLCPNDISVDNDGGVCGAMVTYTIGTEDNCEGETLTQTAGQPSGTVFPVGTTTNTFEVTDVAGNSVICSFDVTVNDTEYPTISCINDISVIATSSAGAVVNFTAPEGTDNCAANMAQMVGLSSGSTFPIGTTVNSFATFDPAGNSTSCSFNVTVTGIVPDIVCPADITVSNDGGLCEAMVDFAATETVGIPASTITYSIAPGSGFQIGTTIVTATATNAVGSSSCTFTVTVNDTEDPTITCPGDMTVDNDASACGAVVTYTISTSDNCAGASWAQTAGLASGSEFPVGTTTNTFVVTDAVGNTASCSFTVTVNDTENPTISCPGNMTLSNDTGDCGAVVTYTIGSSDNCPGESWTQTAGLASGSEFPIGTTTNTFEVTDAAGNTASCSFTVTVNDTENPTISCPGDIAVDNDASVCGAVVTYTIGTSDNCAGASWTQTAGLASGSEFPIGTTTNTFEVTDAAGNTASCSFTVTVQDVEAPVIIADLFFLDCVDGENADLYEVESTVTDNCDNSPEILSVISIPQMDDPIFKFKKKNKKKLKFNFNNNKITIEAPGNGGAEAWWAQIEEDGGVEVVHEQLLNLTEQQTPTQVVFDFTNSGALEKVFNDSMTLVVTAQDVTGNVNSSSYTTYLQCGANQGSSSQRSSIQRSSSQDDAPESLVHQSTDEVTLGEVKVFPNPFRFETTVEYNMSTPGEITIQIFDLNGRLVKWLWQGDQQSGFNRLKWDGTGQDGRQLPAGMYLIQLSTDDELFNKKVLLLRD